MKNLFVAFFITLCVVSQFSFGSAHILLRLIGQQQGLIEGNDDFPGMENWITVHTYEHSIAAVRDRSTCQPNGQLNHQALKIVKHLDNASPKLLKALVDNEELHGELRFYRPNAGGGTAIHYYTIEFTGAHITDIRHSIPSETSDQYADKESISFAYGRIIETHEPSGVEEEADWQSDCGQAVRISDLNFDGVVNLLDLSIMAGEWLMPY